MKNYSKTTILKLIFFFNVLCFSCLSFGQTNIEIGKDVTLNTNTTWPSPYGNWYWGAKHQMLILATELTTAGASSGDITSLAFNVAVPEGTPLVNFTIKIKFTAATALTTTFDNTGFTTVFGPVTYTETAGWNTHTFSTPFNWDGTSNLLIETCFNNSSYTNNATTYYSTTLFNSCTYYNADAATVCTNTTGTAQKKRPNMMLGIMMTNPPVAKFGTSSASSCNGVIAFRDSSSNKPTSWLWDLGDTQTSTSQHPYHTYTSPGTYTVSLKACNIFGCDSITKTNYITVGASSVLPSSCFPIDTTYCCNYGIYNVTFNTINKTSANGLEGMRDYTCTDSTTVTEGLKYNFSVQTNSGTAENVMAWIDFNNNTIFDTTELIFTSLNKILTHSDSIKIPGGAVDNIPLRMRVVSDTVSGITPTACGNSLRGQHEDYAIKVLANPNPPIADFTADVTTLCVSFPMVNFTDKTINVVNSWLWNFGDGFTDTTKNPSHNYTVPGIYPVTVIATNSFGTDTLTKTSYINVSGGPKPPLCTPQTTGNCCGVGIYNMTFNTINNTTADGSEGYKDYSCLLMSTVNEGQSYPISVKTNATADEHVRVWIDFNNDGKLHDTTELVFSSKTLQNHSGTIFIPSSAIKDSALRLRVASEIGGLAAPKSCNNVQLGQHEDYSIVITASVVPPVADFSVSDTLSCSGTIKFTDLSANAPTSWLWKFGDGTTSTLQNPLKTYTKDSTFSVILIATNAFGSDTITKTSILKIATATNVKSPSCSPSTIAYCCGYGIYKVTLGTINNISADASEGYKDFSCISQTDLTEGSVYTISIQTGSSNTQDTKVWIDFNDNGNFTDSTDLVFTATDKINPTGSINIPPATFLNKPLRMRIASDYNGSNPTPCQFMQYGQVEDYGIILRPNTNPPVVDFSVDNPSSCDGVVNFTDLSSGVVTSWLWDFGDGFTDTTQNPTHSFPPDTVPFTVKLIVSNAYGSDTIVKSNLISISCDFVIGTDTKINSTTAYPAPYGNYYWGARHQFLILASEIKAVGITKPGPITALGFNVAVPNGVSLTDFNIKIKNTTLSALTTTFIDTGLITVFGPSSYTDVSGWNMHTFSAPFVWDGVSNLIIETCFNNPTYTDNAQIYYTTYAYNTSLYYRADNAIVCKNTTGTTSFDRPNIKLIYSVPPPTADFIIDDTLYCNGIVSFSDLSIDATYRYWNFGDGNISNLQNPVHVYDSSGLYSVMLIASNTAGSDTIIKTNYVNVLIGDAPKQPACLPSTLIYCCGYGIYKVSMQNINHSSGDGAEGYRDFSCIQKSNIYVDYPNTITVYTNPDTNYKQDVRVYIDLNNDAIFDNTNELVFTANKFKQMATGVLDKISPDSTNLVYDSLLRMRVVSDYTGFNLNACNDVQYGQVEDYGVTLKTITDPPVADFTVADTTVINCGDSVQFIDLSTFATSWFWNFNNGLTDSIKNPIITFSDAGIYTVNLKVFNKNGSDTANIINYITVNCIKTIPTSGTTLFDNCSGKLFDSGGNGNYQNNTNSIVTIKPAGASSITLDFISFSFDSAKDFLSVYDGKDTTSTLIGKYTGTSLPNGGSITSSSGPITLYQQTDASISASGFEADFSCSRSPFADFIYEIIDTCQRIVSFTDSSYNNPTSWLWEFGDGTTSASQNVTHAFPPTDVYIITLIASNALGSDTLIQTFNSNSITAKFTSSKDSVNLAVLGDVNFTDNSKNATSWNWDFGDGGSSTLKNPTHTYTQIGTYTVTLVVSDGKCTSQKSKTILVFKSTGLADGNDALETLSIYPNPTHQNLTIDYSFAGNKNITIKLFDLIGTSIYKENINCQSKYYKSIDLSNYSKGIYILFIHSDETHIYKKVILQ